MKRGLDTIKQQPLSARVNRERRRRSAATSSLLLKFRTRDTQSGVTRETVKALAARFGLSEAEVVHLALSRMAKEELPAYEADDEPLSGRDIKALGKIADTVLPKGRVLKKESLF